MAGRSRCSNVPDAIRCPGQIVFVQPLPDHDDAAALLVVQSRDQRLLIEVLAALAFNGRDGIHCLQQVINDDQISAVASHRSAK